MKILFCIQDYGPEAVGGAEAHCRMFATRLVARGHEVTIATSCADSYLTWQNVYETGESQADGVRIVRFPVRSPRNPKRFQAIDRRTVVGYKPNPLFLQREWQRLQGPELVGYSEWLVENANQFDVAIPFAYLYSTSSAAIECLAGRVPILWQPLIHDEPPAYLPIFKRVSRLVNGVAFNSLEELQTYSQILDQPKLSSVVGIGSEIGESSSIEQLRNKFGLGTDDYFLYVGRIDEAKGCDELIRYFDEYLKRSAATAKLVIAGDQAIEMPEREWLVKPGRLSEEDRNAAMAGAIAFILPSYYESFSMVLTESWLNGTPVIVQGRCAVSAGQVARSGGGFSYSDFAEFVECLETVREPAVRQQLAESGQQYCERNYKWNVVLDRYETLIEWSIEAFSQQKDRVSAHE